MLLAFLSRCSFKGALSKAHVLENKYHLLSVPLSSRLPRPPLGFRCVTITPLHPAFFIPLLNALRCLSLRVAVLEVMFQSVASVIVMGLKLYACGRLKRWALNGLLHALGILDKSCQVSRHTCLLRPVFLRTVSSCQVLENWIAIFNPWRIVLDSSFSST